MLRMDSQQISDLFMIFNVSGDGSMSKQEFVFCWNGWIKKVSRRVTQNNMEYKKSPYPETDIRTLYWDFAISNNENPEIAVERDIKYLKKYNVIIY